MKNVALADAQPGDIFWREGYMAIYLGMVGEERLMVGPGQVQGSVTIHDGREPHIKAVLRPSK